MNRNLAATAGVLALLFVHLGIARWIGEPSAEVRLWLGFLPAELGLRLAWMACAGGFLAWWIRAAPEPEGSR